MIMSRLLIPVLLAASACGGGGGGSASSADTAAPTTTAVLETTTTIDPVEEDRDSIVGFWRAASDAGSLSRQATLDFTVAQGHPIFAKAPANLQPTRANCDRFFGQNRASWSNEWVVNRATIVADPDWSPPFAPGQPVDGRVYIMTLQQTQGGETTTNEAHAAVMPDGKVLSFLFCPTQ